MFVGTGLPFYPISNESFDLRFFAIPDFFAPENYGELLSWNCGTRQNHIYRIPNRERSVNTGINNKPGYGWQLLGQLPPKSLGIEFCCDRFRLRAASDKKLNS